MPGGPWQNRAADGGEGQGTTENSTRSGCSAWSNGAISELLSSKLNTDQTLGRHREFAGDCDGKPGPRDIGPEGRLLGAALLEHRVDLGDGRLM